MTFHTVVAQILVVVVGMVCLAAFAIVGPRRLSRFHIGFIDRARTIAPYLAILGSVLIVNRVARRIGPELSWIIGWNITSSIYAVEGPAVAALQTLAMPVLTTYFSFVYIYGYVFLLVFPLIAYFALEEVQPLRQTIVAYSCNYGIGVVCYVVFIAYGPRNFMPELVEPLLYTQWPHTQMVTSQVNVNSNVFPSLHASLSITVALLAYHTRRVYPRWFYVAAPIAASVVVATMYLGIHWALDVIAGGVLAVFSVYVARQGVAETANLRSARTGHLPGFYHRVRRVLRRVME